MQAGVPTGTLDPPPPDDPAECLAARWTDAVKSIGFSPLSTADLRRLLTGCARRLHEAMSAEPFAATDAREVGATLIGAHLTEPRALEITLALLGRELAGPADRSRAVLAAIAAGYSGALRERTLVEQERLGTAVVEAHKRLTAALRESEERFRAIFTEAAVGIGIADVGGRLIQVNQAMADLLGYTVEELCGLDVAELAHPTDGEEMWHQYGRLVRGERDHARLEKAYRRKGGGVVWTDLTISLIRDEHGRPQYTLGMVEDVTERHRLEARLRHQASHDPLTGLPNRTLFSDRLAAAFKRGTRVALCYLDLDGFKRVNDSLGHDVGDELLVAVGKRLHACVARHGHLAARMGGDEFVVLLDGGNEEQAVALARAILDRFVEPVETVAGHRLRVSASIGVVAQEASESDPAEILKAADLTLYQAKADGRGRWARYDADRNAVQVARYSLAEAMPGALERGEFTLVYQPLIALRSGGLGDAGELCGVEALLRWNHPQFGRLTPDRFIELAEESGFIVPLGRWVLEEACRQAAQWRAETGTDLFVSVNVAIPQTHEPTLVSDVLSVLDRTGLPSHALQLELTESAMMETAGGPLEALRALAAHGIRLAIDDFGTGYSNLAYLRSLPVHVVKLAGPFMHGLREAHRYDRTDEQIVDTLIRLAHVLGLSVTAEGVETAAQADRLRGFGCDAAQGWYFAAPESPEAVAARLREVTGRPSPTR